MSPQSAGAETGDRPHPSFLDEPSAAGGWSNASREDSRQCHGSTAVGTQGLSPSPRLPKWTLVVRCWPSEEGRAGCGEPRGLSFPVCLPVPVFPGVPVRAAWGALRKGFRQVLWLILEPLRGAGRTKWGLRGVPDVFRVVPFRRISWCLWTRWRVCRSYGAGRRGAFLL